MLSDPPTVQELGGAVIDALLARRPLLAAIWPSLPPSQAAAITPTRLRERCRFVSRAMAVCASEDEEGRARAVAAELAMQRQIDTLGAEESADLDDAEVAARVCEAAAREYGAAQEREIVDRVIAEIARWRRELGPVESAWLGAEAAARGVAWGEALRLAQRKGLRVPEIVPLNARETPEPLAPPVAGDVLFDQAGSRPVARMRERGLRLGSWDDARGRYAVGSVHDGRVACVRSFGTVVELEPGVDGIIQASDRDDHPGEEHVEGDEVRVRVVGVDRRKRRIELTTRLEGALEEAPTQPLRPSPTFAPPPWDR